MTEVEATLWGAVIGGGIGIVSAFFGYIWNRRVTRESNKITEFNKAAAIFNAAFLDEIIFLEDAGRSAVSPEILKREEIKKREGANSFKTAYMNHRKAMIIFRPYIDKSDIPGFDAAWSAYDDWPKHCHDDYDFKSHLDNLLEYANPK